MGNVVAGVLVAAVAVCALGLLAWLCAKVATIEKVLTATFERDTAGEDALGRLQADHDEATAAAAEAARLARHTSEQVDITAELGHQNAARGRAVAHDLAESIRRADAEPTGEAGAAADAGLRSAPDPKDP